MGRKTALFKEHERLGAKIVDFAGWEMPVYYSAPIKEHLAVRGNAGLFDTCHMGEIVVEGRESLELLQLLVTRDCSRLSDGKMLLGVMCNEEGGILDDLTVYRVNEEKYMLASAGLGKIGHYEFAETEISGVNAIVSRSGYTGEEGFELYFEAEKAAVLWQALLEAGAVPCGLAARDTLRLECCLPLYGHELDEQHSPLQGTYGWAVDFGKEFIGREALLEQKQSAMEKLVAFEMLDRAIARQGHKIFAGAKHAGMVTSGSFSPSLKKNIGLAYIGARFSGIGQEFEAEIRNKRFRAVVVKKPFYKRK
jgi:aminomethyltransferase